MTCDACTTLIESCPPFANKHDVDKIAEKICTDCIATVPTDTLPSEFCAIGFGGVLDPCCDMLIVYEGNNIWWSDDCSQWYLIGATVDQDFYIPEVFFAQTKGDSLSGVFDVTGIPATYDEIYFELTGRATSANALVGIRINGDAVAGNYSGGYWYGGNAATVATANTAHHIGFVSQSVDPANVFGRLSGSILEYANGQQKKNVRVVGEVPNALPNVYGIHGYQNWNSTVAVNRIELYMVTGGTFFAVNSRLKVWLKKEVRIPVGT
jgi:hypothetical protein